MDFKAQLMDKMKTAMKARDSVRVSTLRYLLSEVKNTEIDEGELTEERILKLIAKQVKQMKEGIESFKLAGNADAIEEETQKIAILEEFLPEQMSDEAIAAIVAEVLASTEERNMGKLMGMVMAKVSGKADGNRVSAAVKSALA